MSFIFYTITMKNKFLLLSLLLSMIITFSQAYARELTSSDVFHCCSSFSFIDTCSFYDCAVNKHWDNSITSISSWAFLGYSNLKKLNFMWCDIVDIKDWDFIWLPDLTELDLSLNLITNIESWDFYWLSKLTKLDLWANNITTLKQSDFSLLPKLTTLNLAWNPLISIESWTFESIPFLSSLSIFNTCTTLQFNFSFTNNYCSDGVSTDQTTCENKFICTDGVSTNQTACESNFVCTDGSTIFSWLTNQTACENAWTCSDGVSTDMTTCENGGTCDDGVSTDQTTCEGAWYMWNPSFRIGWYMRTTATRQNAWYTRKTNNIQASTDNNLCSVINSTTPDDFITALLDRSYSTGGWLLNLGSSYYVWDYPISFNAWVTNQILVNTIMVDTNGGTVEIQYEQWTAITSNGHAFSGVLQEPILFNAGAAKLLKDVVSVVKFWWDTNKRLDFSKPVTVRLPAPGKTVGDSVKIYYSQWLSSWTFHTNATVINIGWNPYVEFTTTHATYFSIGDNTWLFTIDNDTATTTSQNVMLNMSAPWAQYMRFSNTSGSNQSPWEPIASTKPRTLSDWAWTKTVYAEFDTDWNTNTIEAFTFDSIEYIDWASGNWIQWNITLTITWWVTECVYGTSMNMNSQEVQIGIPYTFTWTFPSTWYCQDYDGIVWGWALTIQTADLYNENNNVISGSNLLISHDPVVIEGDSACTWYNGAPTQFYNSPYPMFTKNSGTNKICKASASNVSLLVNVPANQAPGNYSGTLTIYVPNF